jgi:hypothetical protein
MHIHCDQQRQGTEDDGFFATKLNSMLLAVIIVKLSEAISKKCVLNLVFLLQQFSVYIPRQKPFCTD